MLQMPTQHSLDSETRVEHLSKVAALLDTRQAADLIIPTHHVHDAVKAALPRGHVLKPVGAMAHDTGYG